MREPAPGTLRIVLLGRPVAHSRSPELFRGLAELGGPPVDYEAREVDDAGLADALAAIRAGRLDGANVTVPHKRAACALVDTLSDRARACGSLNVVAREAGGRLAGDSTDGAGFFGGLGERLAGAEGRAAVICGTGGAARAVAAAVASRGLRPLLVSRDPARASHAGLSRDLGAQIAGYGSPGLGTALSAAALVVQATPLGAAARPGEAVPLAWERVPQEAVAVDLVYEPWETPFLRAARARSLAACNGWPMLVHQAAAALDLWAGEGSGAFLLRRARRIEPRDPWAAG